MNIYNIFATFAAVLIHLLHANDHRALAPLLDAPEPGAACSICYIITPPAIPLTIDPSPPVLAPPFDPDYAPTPPYTFVGATSAGHGTNSFSIDWAVVLLEVIIFGLLVHEAVAWFVLLTGNGLSNEASFAVRDHPTSSSAIPPAPPAPSSPSSPPFPPSRFPTDGRLRGPVLASPLFSIPITSPSEGSDRVILSSRSIRAAAPSSSDSPIQLPVSAPVDSEAGDIPGMPSLSSLPSLHSSSSISDEAGDDSEVAIPFNGNPSVSTGSIAHTAAQSVRNFLDEISLALSPSPSFVIRAPPVIPRIPRNLWEDLVDACFNDEPSVWDCYPRATPRTPVDLDDEVIKDNDECVEATDVVEPLVHAWTMHAEESSSTSTSTAQDVERVDSTGPESAGSSREAPSRIPRFAPTPAWKKSISALISGDGRKATRSLPARTSATSTDVIAPTSSSVARSEFNAPKKLDWSEDVEETLFSPSVEIVAKKVEDDSAYVGGNSRVSKAHGRVLEKCDCALETALFEPESWNKFKIPASCHPRPPIHFFAPRDVDKCNPSTRIVVDNVNAFRHHSTEPNVPYANKDIEDLFYPAGAKNVRCFDGRIVGGVLRYNTSYAVVDFETVEDAKAAFKMFQGRKAYPGSFHLRLRFVDVDDRTFGRRMAMSMGPMERSEEERKGFAEFVEDLDRVDVDLTKVVVPSRPGFTLPPRPATPSKA